MDGWMDRQTQGQHISHDHSSCGKEYISYFPRSNKSLELICNVELTSYSTESIKRGCDITISVIRWPHSAQ